MTDRIVEYELDRTYLIEMIMATKLPFTCTITPGKHRTYKQNKLQRRWIKEISQATFQTEEEVRGYIKLTFGVPILKADNEAFALAFDRLFKGRSYEEKIAFMMEPISIPVTSIMTTKQKTRFLDAVFQHFAGQGIRLTIPDDEGLKA